MLTVIVQGVDPYKIEKSLRVDGFLPIEDFEQEVVVNASDGHCQVRRTHKTVLGNRAGIRSPVKIFIADPGERCLRIEVAHLKDISFVLSLIAVPRKNFEALVKAGSCALF